MPDQDTEHAPICRRAKTKSTRRHPTDGVSITHQPQSDLNQILPPCSEQYILGLLDILTEHPKSRTADNASGSTISHGLVLSSSGNPYSKESRAQRKDNLTDEEVVAVRSALFSALEALVDLTDIPSILRVVRVYDEFETSDFEDAPGGIDNQSVLTNLKSVVTETLLHLKRLHPNITIKHEFNSIANAFEDYTGNPRLRFWQEEGCSSASKQAFNSRFAAILLGLAMYWLTAFIFTDLYTVKCVPNHRTNTRPRASVADRVNFAVLEHLLGYWNTITKDLRVLREHHATKIWRVIHLSCERGVLEQKLQDYSVLRAMEHKVLGEIGPGPDIEDYHASSVGNRSSGEVIQVEESMMLPSLRPETDRNTREQRDSRRRQLNRIKRAARAEIAGEGSHLT